MWPEAWLKALIASHHDAQLAPVKMEMWVSSLDIVKKIEDLKCNSISVQFQHRFITMVVMLNHEQLLQMSGTSHLSPLFHPLHHPTLYGT